MRQLTVPPLHRSYRLRPEIIRRVAIGQMSFLAALAHDATNARGRKRPISIGTPPELIAGVQARSNTSTARTSAGAKIRLFDSIFALCRALILLFFFGVSRALRYPDPGKPYERAYDRSCDFDIESSRPAAGVPTCVRSGVRRLRMRCFECGLERDQNSCRRPERLLILSCANFLCRRSR